MPLKVLSKLHVLKDLQGTITDGDLRTFYSMCMHLPEMQRVKMTRLQDRHQLMVKLEFEPRSSDSLVHDLIATLF